MYTTSFVHIVIISSFMNSTKSLLYTVLHWVLNFLWSYIFLNGLSVNSLFDSILYTSSFIWTSSHLPYLFAANESFSSYCFRFPHFQSSVSLLHSSSCSLFLLWQIPVLLSSHFYIWHDILVWFTGALISSPPLHIFLQLF